MPIDPKFLTLTQWLSPSFPIGAFAYSHGVEQAIYDGWIVGADDLQTWLASCLTQGSARSDAGFLRLAFAAENASEINATARAFAASHERVMEAEKQGAAFVRTVNAVWKFDLPDLLLPVAVGAAAARARLDPDAATSLYLQAFASNLVSASMRLMPLGQSDGQAVLAALQPLVSSVADDTRETTLETIFSNAFLSDIAAMRHETLQPRLFQS
ncbi:MAG: urease accessory protein UreF [Silicimonas sp.]|nr:urease accessory protein UreF [Silicimonas sp.]